MQMFDSVATDISGILDSIEGWFFQNEAAMLSKYAAQATNCIVEVGSYRGRSTVILGLAAKVPVYAVDPHINCKDEPTFFGDYDRKVWTDNIVKYNLAAQVRPINLESHATAAVWSQPIDLLFIDGAHHYEAVKGDLQLWLPHVTDNGFVALHDNNWQTVQQAINERHDLILVEKADLTSVYKIQRG